MLHVTQAQESTLQGTPIMSDQHANTTQVQSTLRREWIEGVGSVLIAGELQENSVSSSSLDSVSGTVAMFNLDKLNENQLEWLRRHAWGRGQIHEASNHLVEFVVQDVNRDRLQFDFGGSSLRPGIRISHLLG